MSSNSGWKCHTDSNLAEHDFPLIAEPVNLGDVSFHTGWTFHRAGANNSEAARAVMTVIYMDVDIELVEPTLEHHLREVERWMPGTKAGETPDSPLNPVLYARS